MTPITSPWQLITGPPELPGLIGALIWIICFPTICSRPLTIPVVLLSDCCPSGYPKAINSSERYTLSEPPNGKTGIAPKTDILSATGHLHPVPGLSLELVKYEVTVTDQEDADAKKRFDIGIIEKLKLSRIYKAGYLKIETAEEKEKQVIEEKKGKEKITLLEEKVARLEKLLEPKETPKAKSDEVSDEAEGIRVTPEAKKRGRPPLNK